MLLRKELAQGIVGVFGDTLHAVRHLGDAFLCVVLVGISIFFSGSNVNGEGTRKAAPKGGLGIRLYKNYVSKGIGTPIFIPGVYLLSPQYVHSKSLSSDNKMI